jgi:3D (Asp-Asp-Asp) domain-containing protein
MRKNPALSDTGGKVRWSGLVQKTVPMTMLSQQSGLRPTFRRVLLGGGVVLSMGLGTLGARRLSVASPVMRSTPPVSLGVGAEPVALAKTDRHQPRVLWMDVTAYCPCKKCCGHGAHGVTASGHSVAFDGGRFAAADTDVLPFGTKIRVPGYHNEKAIQVIDRGSAIRGHKLDVFFPDHEQAMQWGHRGVQVAGED